MRKVQSAPNLASLDKGASSTPKHMFNNNAPLAFKTNRAPGKPHHNTTTTKAMVADHHYTAPVSNPAVEMVYAITSRGILSTTECLPIEMEMIAEAPSLQDQDEDGDSQSLFTTTNNNTSTSAAAHHPPPHRHSSGEMEMAACLAAPALPDRSNAEIVATKAARMASTAEAQVRVRYAVEVAGTGRRIGSGGGGNSGNGTFLRRSLLNRKRSLDDLDLLHLETFELLDKAASDAAAAVAAGGSGGGGVGIAGISGLGRGGGGQLPSSASSPETKRLLTSRYHHGLIEDASGSGNRLHVEEVPTVTPSHESLASIEIFMDTDVEVEKQQQQQQEEEEEEEEEEGRMKDAVVPLPLPTSSSPGRQQEQNNKQPGVLKDAKNVMEKNHVVPFTLGKKKMNTADNEAAAAAGNVI